jgi:hypothetical protein
MRREYTSSCRLFVRRVARVPGDQAVAAFSLRGEQPLDGSPDALDTARALAALTDPPTLALPSALPFAVGASAGAGVKVLVASAKDHKAAFEAVCAAWMVAAGATVPGATPAPFVALVPRMKVLASTLQLEPAGFAGLTFPFSFATAAPMLVGMLARLAARGVPIERVEIG